MLNSVHQHVLNYHAQTWIKYILILFWNIIVIQALWQIQGLQKNAIKVGHQSLHHPLKLGTCRSTHRLQIELKMVSWTQGNEDVHFVIQKIMEEKRQYFKDIHRFSEEFWKVFDTYIFRIIFCSSILLILLGVSGLNSH